MTFDSIDKKILKDINLLSGDVYSYSEIQKRNDIPEKDTNKETDIYIISTYPNTNIKYETTKKCIESLKQDDRKIMISSHMPLSEELQDMVDYYIYDEFNPLIKHTLYNNYWYETNDFRAEVLFKSLSK